LRPQQVVVFEVAEWLFEGVELSEHSFLNAVHDVEGLLVSCLAVGGDELEDLSEGIVVGGVVRT